MGEAGFILTFNAPSCPRHVLIRLGTLLLVTNISALRYNRGREKAQPLAVVLP